MFVILTEHEFQTLVMLAERTQFQGFLDGRGVVLLSPSAANLLMEKTGLTRKELENTVVEDYDFSNADYHVELVNKGRVVFAKSGEHHEPRLHDAVRAFLGAHFRGDDGFIKSPDN